MPTPEIATWFRTALQAAVVDALQTAVRAELTAMQDRLLNAYLAGTVDANAYKAKCTELKSEAARNADTLAQVGNVGGSVAETALALYDWSQTAGNLWRGSNNGVRREILDVVCLNRTLSDASLVTEKRKPFDVFAKRPEIENSRGNWTSFELFLGPFRDWKQAQWQHAESCNS